MRSFILRALRVGEATRRGAVAVEAAVVIPIMIVLMMAVVDFGRFFYAQLVASQAVAESSRALSLGQDVAFAQGVALALMDGVPTMAGGGAVAFSGSVCPEDVQIDGSNLATVQVSFSFSWLTPLGLLAGDQVAILPGSVTRSASAVCRS